MNSSGPCLLYLLVISFFDFRAGKIPNIVTAGFFAFALLADVFQSLSSVPQNLACAFLFFIIFLTTAAVTKGLGMGDVKMSAAVGYCAGFFRASVIFILACGIGILSFLASRLFKNKMDRFPFAPFVAAGYAIEELFCGRFL